MILDLNDPEIRLGLRRTIDRASRERVVRTAEAEKELNMAMMPIGLSGADIGRYWAAYGTLTRVVNSVRDRLAR